MRPKALVAAALDVASTVAVLPRVPNRKAAVPSARNLTGLVDVPITRLKSPGVGLSDLASYSTRNAPRTTGQRSRISPSSFVLTFFRPSGVAAQLPARIIQFEPTHPKGSFACVSFSS